MTACNAMPKKTDVDLFRESCGGGFRLFTVRPGARYRDPAALSGAASPSSAAAPSASPATAQQ